MHTHAIHKHTQHMFTHRENLGKWLHKTEQISEIPPYDYWSNELVNMWSKNMFSLLIASLRYLSLTSDPTTLSICEYVLTTTLKWRCMNTYWSNELVKIWSENMFSLIKKSLRCLPMTTGRTSLWIWDVSENMFSLLTPSWDPSFWLRYWSNRLVSTWCNF